MVRTNLRLLAAAKSLQSCPTLCYPIDGSPPGSPIPGILQARTPEWVAISFSNAWKWKVKVKSLSRVWLFATPQTVAHQAPPSMGFSRQEYWSGLPLSSLCISLPPDKYFAVDYVFSVTWRFRGMHPIEKYFWPYNFFSKIKSAFQLPLHSNYYFFIFTRKHGIHVHLIFEQHRH